MKNNSGQSIFELIIAILVVSLVLIALVGLATKSVSLTTFSRNKTLATRYTEEVIEWMRGERDSDWATFTSRATTSANWCIQVLAWTNQGTCNTSEMITNTIFTRDVVLSLSGTGTVNATITVKWTDGGGVHESRASTVYTNWKGN